MQDAALELDPFKAVDGAPIVEEPKAGLATRTLGRSVSQPEEPGPVKGRTMQCREDVEAAKPSDTMLYKFIESMHKKIPKQYLLDWIDNLAGYLSTCVDGKIPTGCACSGTGIWSHVNDLLSVYWNDELGMQRVHYQHKFCCEIDPRKRAFIWTQHSPEHIFTDIAEMAGDRHSAHLAFCCVKGAHTYPPWVQEYNAGFVCKDVSLQNSQRKNLKKGKLKSGEGQTGKTYGGARDWMIKTKPFFSFLENVAEILNDDEETQVDEAEKAQMKKRAVQHDQG